MRLRQTSYCIRKITPLGVTHRRILLVRIFLLAALVSKLPFALLAKCKLRAYSLLCFILFRSRFARTSSIQTNRLPKKKTTPIGVVFFFGDPWENRTPVTAVKGRCLSRLTNGPYLVAEIGLEPMTYRV